MTDEKGEIFAITPSHVMGDALVWIVNGWIIAAERPVRLYFSKPSWGWLRWVAE